jgi:hypothetical protein
MTSNSIMARFADSLRDNRVRWGAVAAVGALVLLLAWVVLGGREATTSTTAAGDATVAQPAKFGPQIVSVRVLRSQAAATGHTVYWAGKAKGKDLELTVEADNTFKLRYLPRGASAASTAQRQVAVVSWPLANPLAQARTAAKRKGAMSQDAPGGGIYVTNTDTPNNAYLALPDTSALGEVFSPAPGVAWTTLTSDRVTVLQP